MQIDWITVSAQIVNFLILVWLLKRFLYQPIIRAMERREKHIAGQLDDATKREQQANEQRRQYEEKQHQLDQQREQLLAKAKEDAGQEKYRLLDEARGEITEKQTHWQRQVEQEKEEFLKTLRDQAGDVIESIARKALADLADAELEEQIIQSFINRLKSLDDESRKALTKTSGTIQVSSSFALSSDTRSQVTRAIHENIIDNIDVQYTESPELICGIELLAEGRQLSWNVANYLDELTGRIEQAFAKIESSKEQPHAAESSG